MPLRLVYRATMPLLMPEGSCVTRGQPHGPKTTPCPLGRRRIENPGGRESSRAPRAKGTSETLGAQAAGPGAAARQRSGFDPGCSTWLRTNRGRREALGRWNRGRFACRLDDPVDDDADQRGDQGGDDVNPAERGTTRDES